MAQFSKLLLAIDLSPESELLIGRVFELCRDELSHLHVVHVIKHGLHDSNLHNSDLCQNPQAQRMVDHTSLKIREMLRRHGMEIPGDRIYLVYGEPAFEIKRLASDIDADLVIVGSHTKQNDWMQLPGATTNCVIQGIRSDVMAVKV